MSAGSPSWLSGVLSSAISSAIFAIVLFWNTNDFQYRPSGSERVEDQVEPLLRLGEPLVVAQVNGDRHRDEVESSQLYRRTGR